MMKPILTLIAAGTLTAAADSTELAEKATSLEQKVAPKFSLDVSVVNKRFIRGFTFTEDPDMQSILTASYGNASFTHFGYLNAKDLGVGEFDFFLDYTFCSSNKFNFSAGFGHYTFTSTKPTHDFHTVISANMLLNPTLSFLHDFEEGKGSYLELSAGHQFRATKAGNLDVFIGTTLAYNHHYFWEKSGFSHIDTRISVSKKLTEHFRIGLFSNVSLALDRDFETTHYWGANLRIKY